MKPFFEKVLVDQGSSWTVFHRRLESFPFEWHYHPEFELTMTLNSLGQRYIGDHIGSYGNADLILLGPNLPHTWCSREKIEPNQPHEAIVLWFSRDLAHHLIERWPEFAAIRRLLKEEAGRGVCFSEAVRREAQAKILALLDQPASDRLLGLLSILNFLAGDRERVTLSSSSLSVPLGNASSDAPPQAAKEGAAIDRILSYLHAHYREEVSVADLASRGHVSVSSFHRLFKRHMRMPLSAYLAHLRVGKACSLLMNTEIPISIVANEAGYYNYANFVRQFEKLKRMTPRQFRTVHAPPAKVA
jgi:AraC-like DNA-binding protein